MLGIFERLGEGLESIGMGLDAVRREVSYRASNVVTDVRTKAKCWEIDHSDSPSAVLEEEHTSRDNVIVEKNLCKENECEREQQTSGGARIVAICPDFEEGLQDEDEDEDDFDADNENDDIVDKNIAEYMARVRSRRYSQEELDEWNREFDKKLKEDEEEEEDEDDFDSDDENDDIVDRNIAEYKARMAGRSGFGTGLAALFGNFDKNTREE